MKTKNFKFKSMALVLFALVLSSNVWGADTWTQVTSVAVGDEVVIAVVDDGTKELTSISTTSTKYGIGTEFTTNPAGTMTWKVEEGSSTGTFAFKNGTNYLRWNSGNSVDAAGTAVEGKTSWTITTSNSRAKVANVYTSSRILMWNKSSPRFACYENKNHGDNGGTYYYYVIFYKKAASKTLSSITVKTDPSKVTYTEGDKFDPTGLVITKNYSDATTEDWTYADHASDFTFSPSTSTALTTSNTSVTITVGDKSTTQSITVNAKSKYTVTFYNAGEVVKTVSDVTEGTLFSAIKPTIGTGSGQLNIESCDNSSTHFMGWTTEESFQKRETAPPYVADNDAINDNMTVRAVWAAEE